MKKLTLAYFGSPDFSAKFLEKLLTDQDLAQLIDVKLVVTQPDRPVGRKQILTSTPVKKTANEYKIPIFEVENWKIGMETGQEDRKRKLDKKNPTSNFQLPNSLPKLSSIFQSLDLILVYAYASIIPKELLNIPKYGFWCIHPSLLPKYRGSSPMAASLINGDEETGVTIIKMDEKVDHGPIIAQEKYQILPTDSRPDLETKLTDLGFEMFKKLINKLLTAHYSLLTKKQNHKQATYTKKLSKQDGFIQFNKLKNLLKLTTNHQPLVTLYNLFRGLYPWPGIWTILPNGKRLKVTNMSLTTNHQPLITRVQLEGKNEVDFETFNKAYKIF